MMGRLNLLGSLDYQKGVCYKCGTATIAKVVRFCDTCYKKEEARDREEQNRKTISLLKASSGIPEDYKDTCFEDLEKISGQQFSTSVLMDAIENFGTGKFKLPYLYGPPGTGKTLLAFAACNALIKRHCASAYYVQVPDLMIDSKFYREERDHIKSASMLVLDDLGHHNTNQYSLNILYNILNHRLMSGIGVFVISNFSIDELASKLSNDHSKVNPMTCVALRDRLMAMCVPLELKCENIRIKKSIKEVTSFLKRVGG